MKLYLLEPEVSGGFGENTIILNANEVRQNQEIPNIKYLHYEFSGWLGDDLLETTPCFIITSDLANSIKINNLTGYKLEDIKVSVTDEFIELYPNKVLPKFQRIIPFGTVEVSNNSFAKWTGYDFSLSLNASLVVTEKVLKIIQQHNLNYCDITELTQ